VSAFIEEGCREHAVSRRWPGLRADGGSPILVKIKISTSNYIHVSVLKRKAREPANKFCAASAYLIRQ